MNKGIFFILGAVVGFGCSYYYFKNKFEDDKNKEIQDIREYYFNKYEKKEEKDEEDYDEVKDGKITAYKTDADAWKKFTDVLKENYNINLDKEQTINSTDRPYVITRNEYAEFSDYEAIELHYYKNGVITDSDEELVDDDIYDRIGNDFMDYYGKYEQDTVFIRNDEKQIDYEIVRKYCDYNPAMKGG